MEGLAMPSVGATTLAIKAFFCPEQAQGLSETYELHLGDEIIQVQVDDGDLRVQQGQALIPDAVIYAEMPVFLGLFSGQLEPDMALAGSLVRIEGDPCAFKRLLSLSSVPSN
jgi:putative sterol carrier protein